MKHLLKNLLLSTFVLLSMSCNESDEKESVLELDPRRDITFTRAEAEIGNGANEFSFKLLTQMANEQGNQSFSPLSTHMALSMLCNGAGGDTYEEMIDRLGYKNLDLEVLNSYNQKLMEELPALDKTMSVGIANGFWAKGFLPILDSYKSQICKYYQANISNIDNLNVKKSIDEINVWCDEKTKHMIPSLVDPNDDFDALIANALCFEGTWRTGFDEKATKKEKFHNENGSSTDVQMMSKTNVYGITSLNGLDVIEIPYGNESFSMYVILPKDENESISDAITGLDNAIWTNIKGNLSRNSEIKLSLPKFEIKNNIDLIPILISMGFEKTLSEHPDFSNLCKTGLIVTKAFQKNYFKIDEKGAKAASSTAMEMVDSALPSGGVSTPTFTVNRPFAFIISEKSSSAILFAGIVREM